jgi:hypothetical protein
LLNPQEGVKGCIPDNAAIQKKTLPVDLHDAQAAGSRQQWQTQVPTA